MTNSDLKYFATTALAAGIFFASIVPLGKATHYLLKRGWKNPVEQVDQIFRPHYENFEREFDRIHDILF